MNFKEWKEEFIRYLQEKIKNNDIKYDDFEKAVEAHRKLSFDIQKILEYASKYSEGKDKDKLLKLYRDFSNLNTSEIVEKLRDIGYRMRTKNKEVYERFYDKDKRKPTGIAYRIIQLTRLGKRDEVFSTLLHEFQGNEFPKELAMAFNPVYPDEIFKVFIYSFLSGILGETKKKKEEGGEE